MTGYQTFPCLHFEGGRSEHKEVAIVLEAPLALTVNGEVWLTLMCTPIDLEALAVGFLFNEGVIQSYAEVVDLRLCPSGDNLDIWLSHPAEKPTQWRRTSGCTGGITAAEDGSSTEAESSSSPNGLVITPQKVTQLVATLFEAQNLYRRSGGVHTSILTDGEEVYAVGEDIGRHNTLDKIAGKLLMQNLQPPHRILVTTGRVSSEMLQKAARLQASLVISRTSPSALSIQMAERWGITLIGYARRDQFTVYTHPQRLLLAKPLPQEVAPSPSRPSILL